MYEYINPLASYEKSSDYDSFKSLIPDGLEAEQLATAETTEQHSDLFLGRECSFCGCTVTPVWRNGPEGKGNLCNSCGVKWRNQNQNQDSLSVNSKKTKKTLTVGAPITKYKKRRSQKSNLIENDSDFVFFSTSKTSQKPKKVGRPRSIPPVETENKQIESDACGEHSHGAGKDCYFCKYCETTWPLSFFKNRQQFGAHCSNCSRRRKPREEKVLNYMTEHGANFPSEKTLPVSQQNSKPSSASKNKKKTVSSRGRPRTQFKTLQYDDFDDEDSSDDLMEEDALDTADYNDDKEEGEVLTPVQEIDVVEARDVLLDKLLFVVDQKLIEENELVVIRKELADLKARLEFDARQKTDQIQEVTGKLRKEVDEIKGMLSSNNDIRTSQEIVNNGDSSSSSSSCPPSPVLEEDLERLGSYEQTLNSIENDMTFQLDSNKSSLEKMLSILPQNFS